jgi:eukaryotic-like serine/threonine-protein kinase
MELLKKIGNYIRSKSFLINFGIIILIYVSGYFLLKSCMSYRTNHGQQIEVPYLVGENQNNLENLFSESLLKYEVLDSIYRPNLVEGTILDQNPSATDSSGIFVKEGRVIKLRVSKRTQLVEMPGLVDRSQRYAEIILTNREFRYDLEYIPSREAPGAVIEQKHKGKPILKGKKIPIGSRITLVIGRDEAGVALLIPNLYGLSIVDAKARVEGMQNMSFYAVCNECYTQADSLAARVIQQSPEFTVGAVVASGSTITVVASKEQIISLPQ